MPNSKPQKSTEEEADVEPSTADVAMDEVIDPKITASVDFKGHVYTFRKKRLDATQFRGEMQKQRDVSALEWLIGEPQFLQFLALNSDEDGCPSSVFVEFWEAIGKALSTGNS